MWLAQRESQFQLFFWRISSIEVWNSNSSTFQDQEKFQDQDGKRYIAGTVRLPMVGGPDADASVGVVVRGRPPHKPSRATIWGPCAHARSSLLLGCAARGRPRFRGPHSSGRDGANTCPGRRAQLNKWWGNPPPAAVAVRASVLGPTSCLGPQGASPGVPTPNTIGRTKSAVWCIFYGRKLASIYSGRPILKTLVTYTQDTCESRRNAAFRTTKEASFLWYFLDFVLVE